MRPLGDIGWGRCSQKRSTRRNRKGADDINICRTLGQTPFEFGPFLLVFLCSLDNAFQ